ncbi:MAG: trigger factor [Magnetococcales bacterium]|nr:trigger factor [Magnetococcales bacterium]
MEFTITQKAAFDREITFVFSAAEVEQRLDQELTRLASSVRLPGFRPGKIPRKLLESRFKDHWSSNLADQFYRESFPKALTDHNLEPVDHPEIVLGEFVRGQDYTYRATIQVFPKVEPTGYTGLTLTRPTVTLSDEDVAKVIEEIRASQGRFEADPGRVAVLGDQVLMDFEGFVDGQPFEGGKAEKYLLELGSGRFIPGFEDQLVSCKAGDKREVKVTFPADYGNKELAGKDALFQCFLHEVRARILPELDDELAKKAGVTEGGLDKLRAVIRERLEVDSEAKSEKKVEDAVFEALLQANTFEIPSRLEMRERRNMLSQMKREYQARGVDMSKMGVSDEQLLGMFEHSAGRKVRLGLLLSAIAVKEKIEVDEARVEEHLVEMTRAFGDRAGEVRRMVRENEEKMADLRDTVLQAMVVEWVIKNSTVTEQAVRLDELMGGSGEKGK